MDNVSLSYLVSRNFEQDFIVCPASPFLSRLFLPVHLYTPHLITGRIRAVHPHKENVAAAPAAIHAEGVLLACVQNYIFFLLSSLFSGKGVPLTTGRPVQYPAPAPYSMAQKKAAKE